MRLFELYRYPKPSPGPDVEMIDGHRNIFNVTRWPDWPGLTGAGRVQLDHGIDSVAMVKGVDGPRRPAVLVASKPHRAGSDWTPWHDELHPERGFVRYFGDNKSGTGLDPWSTTGNRSLLAQAELHRSASVLDRMAAAPLLFFESLIHEGAQKGWWRFIGAGIIDRVELVQQMDQRGKVFSNYVFDCTLVDLSSENSELPWTWIAARRDPGRSLNEALLFAPDAWRRWVLQGPRVRDLVRQAIAKSPIRQTAAQLPDPGTPAEVALTAVVDHYKTGHGRMGVGEHRFEALASELVGTALEHSGQYHRGWLTKRSGDGGIDFVSRLDIGFGSTPLRLGVLGQAKCIGPTGSPTNGVDLARTVARLDRGWVGAFVTTGTFSAQAQREIQTDRYPLLLLSGRDVGESVARQALTRGVSVPEYLGLVDSTYETRVSLRSPTDILAEI